MRFFFKNNVLIATFPVFSASKGKEETKKYINMKKIFLLAALVACLASCNVIVGKKEAMVEAERSVGKFTQIHIMGSPTVIYTQGANHSVWVKAPQSVIDKVKTKCNGNCLVVETKGNVSFWGFSNASNHDVVVYVTSPDLTGVEVNGSGDFRSEKPIDTDNISLVVRGSGDLSIDGHLICDNAQLTLSGSGDIDIDNLEALTTSLTVIGSGDMEVRQHKVDNTQMQLTGSGSIKLECSDCNNVNSQLTGSGDIKISGTVKNINKAKAGTGDYYIETH